MLKLYHQVQANSFISPKKRASTPKYVSPKQLTLCGFETPFEQSLTSNNRWVHLSKLIPWDKIVIKYDMQFKSTEGRPPISGKVVIGAVIIKHILNLTDRETILQIQENVFMQYFLGY
jgi:transposase, IS5 family